MPRRWSRIAAAVGLLAAFIVLEIAGVHLRRLSGRRGDDTLPTMIVGFGIVYLAFAALFPAVRWLARRLPVTFARPWTFAVHAAAALAFAVVHLSLVTLVSWIRGGELDSSLRTIVGLLGLYLVPEVFFYGALAAVVMVLEARRALRDRELAAARLGASLAEARLAALRAQLHPHFLFNALNSVGMLVRDERPRDALTVLAELGALLRSLLRDGAAHEVPLSSELDFCRRYLALEQVRFGDRLAVSFETGESLDGALVPNLVLQPLVENAVRHGVAHRAGPGRVVVRAERRGDRLVLEVENDGPPPPDGAAAGTGLGATRGRLASLYGDDHELTLGATGGGAVARVSLPFHTRPLEVAAA